MYMFFHDLVIRKILPANFLLFTFYFLLFTFIFLLFTFIFYLFTFIFCLSPFVLYLYLNVEIKLKVI